MNRYKLIFEYDGTDFSGWQMQPGQRTVEGVAESALSRLYQQPVDLIGQGRTDAGVHAAGQTAHADLPERYDLSRIMHAMKGLLPDDVALIKIEKAEPGFHARFDALSRSYSYHVTDRPTPLKRYTSWFCKRKLDEKKLHQTAKSILGSHDFINFCIPAEDEHSTTNCTVINSEWKKERGLWIYDIEADRFLRHMVRRLVGTMVMVAGGRYPITHFSRLLSAKKTERKGDSAPSRGLILKDVVY